MKKLLAILLIIVLSMSVAFSVTAADFTDDIVVLMDEDDEYGDDDTDPDETDPDETDPDETDPDETDPDETDPDETDPDETDPDDTSETTSDDSSTSETTTKDARNSQAQIEPPEGDGDEYLVASFEKAESVVIVYGSPTVAAAPENPIVAGSLPENSGECHFENGVCTDCGAINNGFAYVNGGWGYFYDQALQTGTTGFVYGTVKGVNGWYYVNAGRLNTNFKGIVDGNINGEDAKWYVEDGMAKDATGAVSSGGEIWYYTDGRVDTDYVGVIDYAGEIWYIENGIVESNYDGIAKTPSGWWYIKDGKVDTRQNLLVECDGNYYYVRNGKVDFSYTGIGRNESGCYRVAGGDWIPSFTGIALAEDGKLYYVKDGHVDFGFTGFAESAGDYWYVSEGCVDKSAFGHISGEIDGDYDDWAVIHGRVVEEAAYTMAAKANDYSSNTEWMMMIDSSANRVGVFRGHQGDWEFVHYWVCTTGDTSDPETVTGKGEFEITDNRGYWFAEYDYTCYYFSGFYGPYLFHSTLFQRDTFEDLNASLGGNASHGCVRLALQNAKWVFYNIPVGTKVLSY